MVRHAETPEQMLARIRQQKPRKPREAPIQKAIIDTLRLKGYYVEKIGNGARKEKATSTSKARFVKLGGIAGFPDLLVIARPYGLVLFLEVKKEDGVMSVNQKAWHANARMFGVHTAVVRSVGEALAAVKQAIEKDMETRKPRMVRMPPPRPLQQQEEE